MPFVTRGETDKFAVSETESKQNDWTYDATLQSSSPQSSPSEQE
ncbi:hypothetical protein PIIN_10452 [Serendipita indica DSM 11827]|uniref:Uncharacterized protein n=1 Tax=Serendipita indica (strain DSM 11827) TaxID=1109443 RepID=G4TYR7_SERID|nr:hypothetical protein PIIN_10452 [Serendipita indica DSM 11827]